MENSVIIFVNNDLVQEVQDVLVRQLFINEVITGAEFDARLTEDPNYVNVVHFNGLKVLVVRSFFELNNRDSADIVIFVKAGLASVESNKVGPPGLTLPVDRLYLHELVTGVVSITFIPNPNLQNNILNPLNPDENPDMDLMPFGTDVNDEPETITSSSEELGGIDGII